MTVIDDEAVRFVLDGLGVASLRDLGTLAAVGRGTIRAALALRDADEAILLADVLDEVAEARLLDVEHYGDVEHLREHARRARAEALVAARAARRLRAAFGVQAPA